MKEKFLKHKMKILIGTGLLVILIITGIISYNVIQAGKTKNLETLSSAAEQNKRLNFWGEVKYDKIYDISIDFPSIVTDIKVKEGDCVSLGQVLVTLDMSEYLRTMDKLEHTSAIVADIVQTQEDIRTKADELNSGTNADLKILQTSLDLAKKEVENAERDVENNQALYAVGAVSKNILDQYTDILAQREKALTDIENNIEKTKKALKTELDQLNISLKSKRSELDQIKIDFDIMNNKSVIDYLNSNQIISCVQNGIVQNIGVINGTRLGVMNTPTAVLQLIDADSIVVSAEVDEEFIKYVTLGETVEIVPVSDASLSIPGTVTQISNVAVEKDGKRIIKVQVMPKDPKGALKPGYSVDVFIPME